MRLQRLLGQMGISSRRKAEILIKEGRVLVNGRVAVLGESADPDQDEITVDGKEFKRQALVYWLLNKPRGVLSACSDGRDRRTVLTLLSEEAKKTRLFPVGRLDMDSEGLLLLTNDGDVSQSLLHPSLRSKRVYEVWVSGKFGRKESDLFALGLSFPEGKTAPMIVEEIDQACFKPGNSKVRLCLIDGKKRQIRRSMEIVGCRVDRLIRVSMGPLSLGDLSLGQSRLLTFKEVKDLRRHANERYLEKKSRLSSRKSAI